jgi:subtilisin family serine protease
MGICQDTAREQAFHKLKTSRDYDVVKVFDSDGLFFGATIEASDDVLDVLEEDTTIAQAWPVTAMKLSTKMDRTTFSDIVNATSYRPHSLTGVDKLHKAGIRGKGVTIGVVDTGLDYTHPDVCAIARPFRLTGVRSD